MQWLRLSEIYEISNNGLHISHSRRILHTYKFHRCPFSEECTKEGLCRCMMMHVHKHNFNVAIYNEIFAVLSVFCAFVFVAFHNNSYIHNATNVVIKLLLFLIFLKHFFYFMFVNIQYIL